MRYKRDRGQAKAIRNRGLLAMQKAGMTEKQWARFHDPFDGLRGIQRHRAKKMYRPGMTVKKKKR